jgi:hypothetical protein
MVGQIGTDENATTFLAGLKKTIKKNRKFAKVVYCTAGRPVVQLRTPYMAYPYYLLIYRRAAR